MADGGSTLSQRTRAAKEHVRVEWDAARAAHLAERARARQRRRTLARATAGTLITAAALAVLAWVAWPVGPAPTPGRAPMAQASHQREASGVLRFADGSIATPLDAGSELVVSAVGDDEIAVEVARGGGRFEVTPGLSRRFVVRAGGVTVSVLGTVFTVRREGDGASVEVERGRVQVRWEPEGEAILGAGDSGAFPRAAAEARDERATGEALAEAEPPAETEPEAERPTEVASAPPARRERAPEAAPEVAEPREEPLADSPPEPLGGWRALAEEGRFDEGYGLLLADSGALRSEDVEVLMQAADVARLSGHPGESLAYLRRALDIGGGDARAPMAAFTLGRVLLQELGRPAEAAAAFARCRALAPEGSLAADALAREVESWHRAGDPEQARERALEYLRLHPQGLRASAVRRYGGIE